MLLYETLRTRRGNCGEAKKLCLAIGIAHAFYKKQ
jgi:hypothetical protein